MGLSEIKVFDQVEVSPAAPEESFGSQYCIVSITAIVETRVLLSFGFYVEGYVPIASMALPVRNLDK